MWLSTHWEWVGWQNSMHAYISDIFCHLQPQEGTGTIIQLELSVFSPSIACSISVVTVHVLCPQEKEGPMFTALCVNIVLTGGCQK